MNRVVHLVSTLGVIAVPVFGWFTQDWSGATTLAVYWFETVAATLFILGRIALHQRWSPKRGHFDYNAPGNEDGRYRYTVNGRRRRSQPLSTYMSSFAVISLSFSAVHGVFLGAVLFLLNHNGVGHLVQVQWRSVGLGCLAVCAFMTVDFLVDLTRLRDWPFRQLEEIGSQVLGRVMVVHMTLLIGFLAIAVTDAPDALFGVFVVLRTMAQLSSALPQWKPARPPAWLANALDRVPNAHRGKKFEEFWAEEQTAERQRIEANERPWQPQP
ncbi:DUF6498-containing protein [Mycolicibacterium sp. 22603]|uniref:DUF6498-containing protein n=1 Tax=Mycolicibacterium sp. 22603 TaxID=3453950 RepID=UPI003F85A61D